jgi:hypothetical protein
MTDVCTVTVKVPATSVTMNKTTATVKVKKTIKLKATMNPKGSTDSLTWSSTNKKCATVSSDGTVKALKYIMYINPQKLYNFTLSEDSIRELSTISKRYIKEHIGKEYNKLDYLKYLK